MRAVESARWVDSDHKLFRQQPDDAKLLDSLRFDLDYDDDGPEKEHLRTELYWYYNPAESSLSFVVYTQKQRCLRH